MTHTTDTGAQEWSDERIVAEAEALAAFWKQHETPRSLWRRDIKTLLTHMRDDLANTIATQAAQLADYQDAIKIAQKALGELHTQLSSQKDYAESLEQLYGEQLADNERLRAELASRQVPDGDVSVPNEVLRVAIECIESERSATENMMDAWKETSDTYKKYAAEVSRYDAACGHLYSLLRDETKGSK